MTRCNALRSHSRFVLPRRTDTFLAASLALWIAPSPAVAAQQDQTWFELSEYVDAGDHWGESVAFVPDIDGDHFPEMLFGAPTFGTDGAVRLVSGRAPHTVLKWHFPELSFDPNRSLGQVVAYLGDVNDDAYPDYAISAPREDVSGVFNTIVDAGEVQLISGKTLTTIRRHKGYWDNARFGEALAGNADVTGDGTPDIMIGAPHYDGTYVDRGYYEIYDGSTGDFVSSEYGNKAGDRLGSSVALLGDLNGDNRSEYAFGVPGYDSVTSGADVGRVYVYNGATHTILYGKTGSQSGGEFGAALCAVGDTDGDGLKELLVGAPGELGKGAAYLYEGSSGTLVRSYSGNFAGERFGTWVSKAGDADQDGFQEIAIGGTEAGIPSGGGFLRVFDGENGSLYKAHDFLTGSGAGQFSSFDGGWDLDLDGWPDLLVGLPDSDQINPNGGGALALGQLTIQSNIGFAGPHALEFSVQGGKLKSGSKADLLLSGGPIGGLPLLVMSAGIGLTPFFGGTLVPNLTSSVILSFPPMPFGTLWLPNIPGGNGPINYYAQFAVLGFPGAEPIGFSNALVLQFLP